MKRIFHQCPTIAVELICLTLLLAPALSAAHPPGLSSLDVQLNNAQIQVQATFALQDIEAFAPMDSDLDAEVSDAEREAAKPAIASLLVQQLIIKGDEQTLKVSAPGQVTFDDQNNAKGHLELLEKNCLEKSSIGPECLK
jgi:hypothetical protein